MAEPNLVLFDAGIFIGALLQGDPRHDVSDWQVFAKDGIEVIGPPSIVVAR
jgi:hypothetical protein